MDIDDFKDYSRQLWVKLETLDINQLEKDGPYWLILKNTSEVLSERYYLVRKLDSRIRGPEPYFEAENVEYMSVSEGGWVEYDDVHLIAYAGKPLPPLIFGLDNVLG